jgi:hypothetical protein
LSASCVCGNRIIRRWAERNGYRSPKWRRISDSLSGFVPGAIVTAAIRTAADWRLNGMLDLPLRFWLALSGQVSNPALLN